jgi:hypothetical protein
MDNRITFRKLTGCCTFFERTGSVHCHKQDSKLTANMKKLFVSAGLIAAGAASIQSASAQSDSSDMASPKAWSVGASLRGFYDDNYDTGQSKKGSFGTEISPTISYNLPLRQTDMGIRYTYGAYYYQDRNDRDQDPFDQTHQVDLWIDHAINERWHLNFTDSFADGQDPELLQPNIGQQSAAPFRVNGDNFANHANLTLNTQWTRELGTSIHYGNDFYDYQNHGASLTAGLSNLPPTFFTPLPGIDGFQTLAGNGASLAGLLNRDEQNIGFDVSWTFSPELKVFAGYTLGLVNYLSNEPISTFNYNGPTIVGGVPTIGPRTLVYKSDARDNISNEGHVGVDWVVTPSLTVDATVGAVYTDSYNDPLQKNTSWAPTANISANYTYRPGSYVQLGIAQSQNATEVVTPDTSGNITQYQYSSVVYADINHQITSKLMATLIGRVAYSTFEGGANANSDQTEYNVGVNLSYQISQHFSTEIGYNYDDLQSQVAGLSYDRNRVYLGVSANY